ncbi:unnamed protein product [Medioppia subpectinata]|uniref:Uncharacterized protein n=1 Tax=Medioppia subpectinata TaxID=1979941 RepID=A0A7R9KIZ0_9ACAR|nr:unnamed protein product [Medioppia subpectinata]CAG2104376.1 unnamed protein product [Medioppia subpectinata]
MINQLNDGLVRLNGWSQVVPISMPWASDTTTNTTTTATSAPNPPHMMTTTHSPQVDYQQNVMHFTANASQQHMNPSLLTYPSHPIGNPLPTTTNPVLATNECPLDVCPDPCTSQTATRWELLNNISSSAESMRSSHPHLKRRNESSDDEYDDGRPVKQYISEEKVSAIFNRLHITNGNSGNNAIHMFDVNDKCEDEDFEDQSTCEADSSDKSPIVFAHELQNAIKSKTMTERLVQSEIDKHSKAVVIWRPNNPLFSIGFNSKSADNDEDVAKDRESANKSDNSFNDSDIDFSQERDEEFIDYDNDMELCL